MLDDYYRACGWLLETGVPSRSRLEGLNLKPVADELAQMGKLPE